MTSALDKLNCLNLKMNEEPTPKEIQLQKCIQIIGEATATLDEVISKMTADERLGLSYLLGSNSVRFNELMKYLYSLGRDLVTWGTENCSKDDPLTIELKDRLIKAVFYIKYFEETFEYLQSGTFLFVNIGQIILGLVLIAGSILSIVFLGGGDAWLVAADVLTGGTGISLFGQGLKNIAAAIKTCENIKHLKNDIKKIMDCLKDLKQQVIISDIHIHKGDHDTVAQCGEKIMKHTANVPQLRPSLSFWDWFFQKDVKLADLDK